VILAPVLLMFVGLIIAAGRVMVAGGSMEAAARDAARQASLARDPTTAKAWALSSARSTLSSEGLQCSPAVSVDTSGFARPVGTDSVVRVEVSCTVRLSDLVVAGMPGSRYEHATAISPIDPYRAVTR
jgi:Flp pilus assembly protein TadG